MPRRFLSIVAVTGLAAACLTASTPTATAAVAAPTDIAASGTFSVLSYNIAGLPEGLSSAPTPRRSATTAIGQRLGPYDIVHVQEDFNYHAYLYAADSHPYRTATSGGAGIGSGLNSLSNDVYDDADFERVRWTSCQLDSGDCLTPKGFTFMRVQLAEGTYLDLYNVHANAGTSAGDLRSRASNLAQLTTFLRTHSAGNAVIVMGDTNSRYTRTGDTIAAFVADNGLTDAWVNLERAGTPPATGGADLLCDTSAITDACEVVDKILYRGNKLITLKATSYGNEHAAFLDASGARLSDHDPITARFTWTQDPALRLSEQFGGPHGDYYTDLDRVPAVARASAISLRAGSRVDQVAVTLADGTRLAHGGTGGTASSITLRDGEHVISAYLCQGSHDGHARIFFARFTTDQGRTLAGGATTSDCLTRTAPSGWQIAGFHGRSGDEVDKIGFIYTRR